MGGVWGAGGEEAREPEPPAATWGRTWVPGLPPEGSGRVSRGEVAGGSLRAAPSRPQGPSSISFRKVCVMVSGVSRALRAKSRPELECATWEAGGGEWGPGDGWAGSPAPRPLPRLPWLVVSQPPAFLRAGLGCPPRPPPGVRRWCGESGEIEAGAPAGRVGLAPGAPSDRPLNR